MSNIRLKVDIDNRSVDIEADKDSFEAVSERAVALIEAFAKVPASSAIAVKADEAVSEDIAPERAADQSGEHKDAAGTQKQRRVRGGGKTANWATLNDLLDGKTGPQLKEFYDKKSPKNQNEQVAVLTVQLKRLLGRDGFDGNEVHTAFRMVGAKTPGNLTAVFGNMATAGLGQQNDKKFVPNWKAEQLVDYDLPHKPTKE